MRNYPKLWYPPGAGGMWLNYVVWCGLNRKNIPGSHVYFEFPYLKSLDSTYHVYFDFVRHVSHPMDSDVRLGCNRAWLNFFVNVIHKKGQYPNWELSGPPGFFEWQQQNINFNLDWCLVFEDPEKFFDLVANVTGYPIKLNQYTETARQQYIQSCLAAESDQVHQAWRNYIFSTMTNATDSDDTRQQQVNEILTKTWIDIKNSRDFLRS